MAHAAPGFHKHFWVRTLRVREPAQRACMPRRTSQGRVDTQQETVQDGIDADQKEVHAARNHRGASQSHPVAYHGHCLTEPWLSVWPPQLQQLFERSRELTLHETKVSKP